MGDDKSEVIIVTSGTPQENPKFCQLFYFPCLLMTFRKSLLIKILGSIFMQMTRVVKIMCDFEKPRSSTGLARPISEPKTVFQKKKN